MSNDNAVHLPFVSEAVARYPASMEHGSPEQTAAMWSRISEQLAELDISVSRAGILASGSRDAVRNIQRAAEKGMVYNPRGDTLKGIAKVLNVNLNWLVDGVGEKMLDERMELLPTHVSSQPSGGGRVRKGGKVEGGAFRPVDLDPDEDEFVSIAPDPRFAKAQQYAWEVVGDSMDAVGIEPGMLVLGVDLHDYDRHYEGLRDGHFVVVQVLRDDGRERALTVKEVRIFKDHMKLVPHSRKGKHETISIYNNQDAEPSEPQYTILAVVIDARRTFV